jgi:hypothetical protein
MVMSMDEMTEGLSKAFEKVELRDPDHLYVPGKVMHMYDLWSKTDYDIVEDAVEDAMGDEDDKLKGVRTAEGAQITDGTSKMLRTIDLDSRFMLDHLAPAYRSSIRSLLDSTNGIVADADADAIRAVE